MLGSQNNRVASVLSCCSLSGQFCGMIKLYRDYFEWLSRLHHDLLHEDDSMVFETISTDEAEGVLRTQAKEQASIFRLLDPTWVLTQEKGYGEMICEGGFIVATFASSRTEGKEALLSARQKSETIAKDFAIHMIADSRNSHPLFQNSIDSLDDMKWAASPMLNTGDGAYDGVICTFTWRMPFNEDLNCHAEETWRELSPIEYD